jgi:hypothetical protein
MSYANNTIAIDSPHDESFGHWVFESAVFLPDAKLKGKKIMLTKKKTYKLMFCSYFGFNEPEIEYGVQRHTLTLMDNPVPPEYPAMLSRFCTQFSSSVIPDVDFVVMPRQTKENYKPNDRPCPVTAFLDVFKTSTRTYRIVNTDDITSLQEQVDLVNSGRTIILTDGSPATVNGILASGKTIYVVRDGQLEQQIPLFPMLQLIQSEIAKRNTLHFIDRNQLQTLI